MCRFRVEASRQVLDGELHAMKKLNEYVKVAEAAEILGVSQNTVRSWAESGKLPVQRNPANGYRLFRRSDLKRFLEVVARTQQKKSSN